jgi:hypothetical protein
MRLVTGDREHRYGDEHHPSEMLSPRAPSIAERAKGKRMAMQCACSIGRIVRRSGPHREGEEPKPMMHDHEKSDSAIVATKPTNSGAIRCGVGGAKGGDQEERERAKHAPDTEPGARVTGA